MRVLFVFVLRSTPGNLMCGLFPGSVPSSLRRVLVLLPCTVEGFPVDILAVFRQILSDCFRQFRVLVVWHILPVMNGWAIFKNICSNAYNTSCKCFLYQGFPEGLELLLYDVPLIINRVERMNEKKTYGVPALLSFFVPGLGQIVKGQVVKAVVIWLALGISWLLQFVLIGFILLPLIWLWQIYDAYNN
jgi:TM2 domain-containing membrane protein YozV